MPLDTARTDARKKSMIYEMSHTLWEITYMTAHIDSLMLWSQCFQDCLRTWRCCGFSQVTASPLTDCSLSMWVSRLRRNTKSPPFGTWSNQDNAMTARPAMTVTRNMTLASHNSTWFPWVKPRTESPQAKPSQCNPLPTQSHFFDVQVSEEPSMKRLLCAEQSFAENSGIISGGYSPSVEGGDATYETHGRGQKDTNTQGHSTRCMHRLSLCFNFNVLSLAHMHTHFFLHSLGTEYALCSCSLTERWGVGLLGLWERTWINGLSFITARGEQPNGPSRRSYIHYQRAFWKIKGRSYSYGSFEVVSMRTHVQAPHVFAQACGECMHREHSLVAATHIPLCLRSHRKVSSVSPNDSKPNGHHQRPRPWRDFFFIKKGVFQNGKLIFDLNAAAF